MVTGYPIRPNPGSATSDSDLFVANVDDLASAKDVLAKTQQATNITNTPDQIEDDADWSTSPTTAPGGQRIVFTSHPVTDDPSLSNQAEIYVMDPDGTGLVQLTPQPGTSGMNLLASWSELRVLDPNAAQ